MAEYKLLYFTGCPNFEKAKDMLDSLEIEYELICQNDLDSVSEFKNFTSPTLLLGDNIIFGSKSSSDGCTVQLPTLKALRTILLF